MQLTESHKSSYVLPLYTYANKEYNQLRRAYILLIASLIAPHLIDEDINDYSDMIIDIEKSCYEDSVEKANYELLLADFNVAQFEQLYRTRITRITKNMDINSEVGDDYLVNKLLAGEVDPKTISNLPPEQLSPTKNIKLLEMIDARRATKMTAKVSTLYKCRQCGKKEATVKSVQMRSLDEGETLVIQCIFCSYKWFM